MAKGGAGWGKADGSGQGYLPSPGHGNALLL